MKQLNINGKSLLLVPVPEGALRCFIDDLLDGELRLSFVMSQNEKGSATAWKNCHLPPGDWELIGKDPLNLSEEEAREIVEHRYEYGKGKDKGVLLAKNYETGEACFTFLESLSSLLRANQMEKAIFLINKT